MQSRDPYPFLTADEVAVEEKGRGPGGRRKSGSGRVAAAEGKP